jgi:hypothetical protein
VEEARPGSSRAAASASRAVGKRAILQPWADPIGRPRHDLAAHTLTAVLTQDAGVGVRVEMDAQAAVGRVHLNGCKGKGGASGVPL